MLYPHQWRVGGEWWWRRWAATNNNAYYQFFNHLSIKWPPQVVRVKFCSTNSPKPKYTEFDRNKQRQEENSHIQEDGTSDCRCFNFLNHLYNYQIWIQWRFRNLNTLSTKVIWKFRLLWRHTSQRGDLVLSRRTTAHVWSTGSVLCFWDISSSLAQFQKHYAEQWRASSFLCEAS